MSSRSNKAVDISAPGAPVPPADDPIYPVFAGVAGVFLVPDSWFGNYVTFFGSGIVLRFGDAAVAVTADTLSGVASGVLTENAVTGAPVEGRLDIRIPERSYCYNPVIPETPKELYFAIDGAWTAYRSSNT